MTTNNLTEQWKKGELPTGIYYIIDYEDLEVIDEYVNGFGFVKFEPKEILAPVPSYEENEALRLKNAQLKELLEEIIADADLSYCDSDIELRIDEVLK